MKIILTAVDEPLANAWRKFCGDLDFVSYSTNIFESGCEAVVSPSNSFGFFDGGLDFLYSEYFGWDLGPRVQKKIKAEFDGELLVGQALVVETNHKKIPYLISAPTMRVPVVLPRNTVNPYLAAKAALICARKHEIESVAFPGLGTGVGEVPPEKCALQVRQAIDDVFGEWMFPVSWHDALDRHTYLYTGIKSRPCGPTGEDSHWETGGLIDIDPDVDPELN